MHKCHFKLYCAEKEPCVNLTQRRCWLLWAQRGLRDRPSHSGNVHHGWITQYSRSFLLKVDQKPGSVMSWGCVSVPGDGSIYPGNTCCLFQGHPCIFQRDNVKAQKLICINRLNYVEETIRDISWHYYVCHEITVKVNVRIAAFCFYLHLTGWTLSD